MMAKFIHFIPHQPRDPFPSHKIRKLSFVIENSDCHIIWSLVDEFVAALTKIPELSRVNIHLRIYPASTDMDPHTVLEPFKMLQHVGRVTFDEPLEQKVWWSFETIGTPKQYANHLKELMEGASPLDNNMPVAYSFLQKYARDAYKDTRDRWRSWRICVPRPPHIKTMVAAKNAMRKGRCEEFERLVRECVKEIDVYHTEAWFAPVRCCHFPRTTTVKPKGLKGRGDALRRRVLSAAVWKAFWKR